MVFADGRIRGRQQSRNRQDASSCERNADALGASSGTDVQGGARHFGERGDGARSCRQQRVVAAHGPSRCRQDHRHQVLYNPTPLKQMHHIRSSSHKSAFYSMQGDRTNVGR